MLNGKNHGFTLVEILVAVALGAAIIAMAVEFTHREIVALDKSEETLELAEAGRLAIDLLREDLEDTGVGLPLGPKNEFFGIELGKFKALTADEDKPPEFTPFGTEIETAISGKVPVMALGLVSANGPRGRVDLWTPAAGAAAASGLVCGPATFARYKDVRASVVNEIGSAAGTAWISSIKEEANSVCSDPPCNLACMTLTFGDGGRNFFADEQFSIPQANGAYQGGTISAGFHQTIWHVTQADGLGTLRRFTSDRDECETTKACGQVVVNGVETLFYRVYRYDQATVTWEPVALSTDETLRHMETTQRLRVDVELIMRALSSSKDTSGHLPAASDLWIDPTTGGLRAGDQCVSSNSPSCTSRDAFQRQVFRTTIELKNAGRGG